MQNKQIYTLQSVNNLLTSSMYALANAQCTLERFDINFVDDTEQRDYLNVIQQQLQQVQDLLKLTQLFADTCK